MFSYTVNMNANETTFKKTCFLIEEFLKEFTCQPLLEDVDGTQIQVYETVQGAIRKAIKVVNDYEVDAVYVDSDINLDHVLASTCVLKHITE